MKILTFTIFTGYTIYLIYSLVNKDKYSILNICIVIAPFVVGTLTVLLFLAFRKERKSFESVSAAMIFGGISLALAAIAYFGLREDENWSQNYLLRVGLLYSGGVGGYLTFLITLNDTASRNEIFRKM